MKLKKPQIEAALQEINEGRRADDCPDLQPGEILDAVLAFAQDQIDAWLSAQGSPRLEGSEQAETTTFTLPEGGRMIATVFLPIELGDLAKVSKALNAGKGAQVTPAGDRFHIWKPQD